MNNNYKKISMLANQNLFVIIISVLIPKNIEYILDIGLGERNPLFLNFTQKRYLYFTHAHTHTHSHTWMADLKNIRVFFYWVGESPNNHQFTLSSSVWALTLWMLLLLLCQLYRTTVYRNTFTSLADSSTTITSFLAAWLKHFSWRLYCHTLTHVFGGALYRL